MINPASIKHLAEAAAGARTAATPALAAWANRRLCRIGLHDWQRHGAVFVGPRLWRCRWCQAWDVDEL